MSSWIYRLALTSYRARVRVVAAWVAVLAILGVMTATLSGTFDDGFDIPGASSQVALDRLRMTFPEAAQSSATFVILAPEGATVLDPVVKDAVEAKAVELEELEWISLAQRPWNEYVDGLISDDRSAAMMSVRLEGYTASTVTDAMRDQLLDAGEELEAAIPGGEVHVGGEIFSVSIPKVTPVEAIGVVVAIIVLLLTLGSFWAAMMPIVSALVGAGASIMLIFIASGITAINSTTMILALMLALAVGIDYSLFIVSRHRDQLATGMDVEESAARATATAGSAVVFAGLTVMIALAGLAIAGIPFLGVMGAFGAIAVAIEVVISLTLLPAMLGFAGEKLRPKPHKGASDPSPEERASAPFPEERAPARASRRAGPAPFPEERAPALFPEERAPARASRRAASAPFPEEPARGPGASRRAASTPTPKRFDPSRWWVDVVTRVPLLTIGLVVIIMGALTIPAANVQLALPNSGRNEPTAVDRITYDVISERFGVGYNGPLVVTGTIIESTDPLGVVEGIAADIEQLPNVKLVAMAVPNANADTGLIQIIPETGPDDPATAQLVQDIRELAPSWQEEYGVDMAVTGFTAIAIDVSDRLAAALLPFGIFVIGLSLVLLTVVFRSILVPIKAALGYLLSIGASFGLAALVFNQGIGKELVNLHEPQPIISFLPIILMGILFGLAMDYEVFLTSRMREEWVHGNHTNPTEEGFMHSAKVVVAAAIIMVSVFGFFIPAGEGAIKPIAFGLAVGVALDAFLIRMTLGPAVMKLLGGRAWWLPAWLARRMPVMDVEGEAITHQLALSDWPAPGADRVIYGENLSAATDHTVLFEDVTLDVRPGRTLVVTGGAAGRRALLLALTGRAKLTSGDLKVLGLVLPQEASVLRRRAVFVDGSNGAAADALAGSGVDLVVVDDADRLDAAARDALGRLAAGNGSPPTALVLGASDADRVRDLVPASAPVVGALADGVPIGGSQ